MRIGIVINSSWNIYNFRMGLIQSFLSQNHEVIAIAPNDGYGQKLEDIGCEFYELNIEAKGSNPAKDLLLVHKLYNIYKKAKLDIVLHYTVKPNIYGTLAAKMLGISAINNVTGLGTLFIRQNFTSVIGKVLYRFAFQFPQCVFFQNEDDRQLFIEQKLVSAHITDTLPGSGINVTDFKPQAFKNNHVFTFLMIARVLYDKGILEYIEAIKILKSQNIAVRCQLLGKIDTNAGLGIPHEQVQQWVDEGLIEYLGTVEDVKPIINDADCVILPSYREGVPRTLIEAASLGKPIITTDVPGCRETVKDAFNGFLCNVKDPKDLAEKMKIMLTIGEPMLRKMGANSRQLAVEKFDINIVIRKYDQVIYKTMGLEQVLSMEYESIVISS
jgi:glycosyltransferase involved in cell wall biosynthesis